ncbi:MAG: MoaD/ThiS family protein [Planctomycetaceae bacterium]
MTVTIEYTTLVRRVTGIAREQVEFPEPAPLSAVLDQALCRHADLAGLLQTANGDWQPTLMVFVNDQQVRPDEVSSISSGDIVTLMLPVSGG